MPDSFAMLRKLLELRILADDCLGELEDAGYEELAKRMEKLLPEIREIFLEAEKSLSE